MMALPVRSVCSVCGHDMVSHVHGTEGGLQEIWICPIHGTRGKPVAPPKAKPKLSHPTFDFPDAA